LEITQLSFSGKLEPYEEGRRVLQWAVSGMETEMKRVLKP
jgi:hypothetical protein